MGILKNAEQHIQKSKLDYIVSVITEYIELSKHGCYVWNNYNKLIMFSSLEPVTGAIKSKPNGLKIYFEQKQQGKINPKKFMIETKRTIGFNDKCVIGMLFTSFLILFDKLLTQIRTNETDTQRILNNARLFNIVEATNQVNIFSYAFFNRQSRNKGSLVTNNTKHTRINYINTIIKELNITNMDTTKTNMPATKERVKEAYKIKFNKKYPYNDKTLEKHIIDAPKATKF